MAKPSSVKTAKSPVVACSVRTWRERWSLVNFAFEFVEQLESVLPLRMPILSLVLWILLVGPLHLVDRRESKRAA
jgi:hypothetical protein